MNVRDYLQLHGVQVKRVPGATNEWYYTIGSKVYQVSGLYNQALAKAYQAVVQSYRDRADPYDEAADLYEEE